MPTEWIKPTSDEHWHALRHGVITSTEVSALFGLSPYLTAFELWHRKRAAEPEVFETNERMEYGKLFEPAIAEMAARKRGWTIVPLKDFAIVPEHRIGASFDFCTHDPEIAFTRIVECKNVDGLVFKRGWEETDYGMEAPAHIEMQVQHQMLVSGTLQATIAAVVGGNRLFLLDRTADPGVHAAIIERVAEFWTSVESGVPPTPDYAKDAEFIASLYQYAEPGKVIQGTDEIAEACSAYVKAAAWAKNAEEIKAAERARILTLIGDAERVMLPGYNLSAGVVSRGEYVVKATSYRNLRITAKKETT